MTFTKTAATKWKRSRSRETIISAARSCNRTSAWRKDIFFSHGKYSEELVRTSVKNLRDTYRAAGYSQAAVVPKVTRKNGNVDITFQVTEGPLDVVQDLRIEGNNTLPEAEFAPHGLNLGPGKPYSQDLVTKDRNQIMARYLTLGYLNAGFHSTAKPRAGRSPSSECGV